MIATLLSWAFVFVLAVLALIVLPRLL